MAILQALLTLISKSVGKILNAIFGWAVRALFGKTTPRMQTMLSALVGGAVAWPLLVTGVFAPKVAALALAFVPLPHSVPKWIVRVVWLALVLIVPLALGTTLAAMAPPGVQRESPWKRLLRGFPITVGLALAFLIMFVSVPIMRLAALVRREQSADVPLVTDAKAYETVAARVVEALGRHGIALNAAEPGWWVKAPTRILAWFGGAAFSAFVPAQIEHYEAPGLAISFYTSGILLRGKGQRLTFAHGIIEETVVHCDGLQTTAPEAQELERRIRRTWKVFDADPAAHAGSPRLLEQVGQLARDLATLDVEYDQWQVLYRQVLQVERAVRGERQLLDQSSSSVGDGKEGAMNSGEKNQGQPAVANKVATAAGRGVVLPPPGGRPAAGLSTAELIGEITDQVKLLAKAQIDLAMAEVKADVRAEVKMAAGLGVSAVAGLLTVNLLLVTAIFALARVIPGWAAGLAVSGAVLLIAAMAAAFGWGKRVRHPMERSLHELKEDVQWSKERLA